MIKKVNKTIYCYIALLVFTVGAYNLTIFNTYFPITEGWFSVYGHLIRGGLVPYKDFDLYITPGYPFLIAGLQFLFGEQIIALRIFGIIIIIIISITLYAILKIRFCKKSAFISTVTAVVYFQSGVAHISYDFIQVFTLFAILAMYLMLVFAESAAKGRGLGAVIALSLSGFLIAGAFLIKHSNGAFLVIFSVFALIFIISKYHIAKKIKFFIVYCISMVIPILVLFLYLYFNNAYIEFLSQIFVGSIDSKGGSINRVLFGWIDNQINLFFFNELLKFSWLIIILIIILYIDKLILIKFKTSIKLSNFIYKYIVLLFSLVFIIEILISYLLLGVNDKSQDSLSFSSLLVSFNLGNAIPPMAMIFCLVQFTYAIYSRITNSNYSDFHGITSLISIGLIAGNATSGAFGEVSTFIAFSIALSFLLELSSPSIFARYFVVLICLSFLSYLINIKFSSPYYWWALREPDIRLSNNDNIKFNNPILSGFNISNDRYLLYSEVQKIIENNSIYGDDIYIYPHAPIFYLMSNRWPKSKSIVSWYDFLPSNRAIEEANRLIKSPPKILIFIDLPDSVLADHERLFRSNGAIGQRDILKSIELLTSNNIYELKFKSEISSGVNLYLWALR